MTEEINHRTQTHLCFALYLNCIERLSVNKSDASKSHHTQTMLNFYACMFFILNLVLKTLIR